MEKKKFIKNIQGGVSYNSMQIQSVTKLSYPFLLLDRCTVLDKKAYGIKGFSRNEDYFNGHFSDYACVPGTVMLEVMSQLFSVMVLSNLHGKSERCVGYDKTRFFKEVRPGDRLELLAEITSYRMNVAQGVFYAYVEDDLVCSTNISKYVIMEEN